MKNLFTLFIVVVFYSVSIAQVPQAFSFQSIVLDANGESVSEQTIGVKVEILEGSLTGGVAYSETHTPTTNSNGVYSINIGQGQVLDGEFSQIPWSSGDKYISLSQDVDGGTNYVFAGANQLLSVPYALVAGKAEIEPMIYVRPLIGNTTNVLSNDDATASANIRLNYEWIQGVPEDIYVEYNNLPANTHLFMFSELGNIEVLDFDNFTGKDTIYEGLRFRSNRLVRTDPNVTMIPGDYDIEIIFRTATTELARVIHPITVIDGVPADPGCLTPSDVGTYTLTENTCPDIESYFLEEIELSSTSEDQLMTKLLTIQEEFTLIQIFNNGPTCFYQANGNIYFEDGMVSIEGWTSQLESTEVDFTFSIEMHIEDLLNEGEPPLNFSCDLKYLR